MKIAMFYELESGGAKRGANEFGRTLSKKHVVDLYYIDKEKDSKIDIYFTETFFYPFIAKKWKGKNWKVKVYKDSIELFHLYQLHKSIANEIHRKNYDFVFIHPSKFTQAPFILRFLKLPKFYYCQEPLRMVYESMFAPKNIDPFRDLYERCIRSIRKSVDKKNILSADFVFANSTFTKKNIYNAYAIDAKVLHMGVDSKNFAPVDIRKEFDLLFIGSYDFVDGYPLFQDSLKLMKKKAKVKYLLRDEGEWITDKKLAQYYSMVKFVICFGFNEPFGLIPLEAMSCGTPVIALNEGGYKDSVIGGKTGVFVPKDPRLIAKIIDSLLYAENWDKMGKMARNEMVKNWTWEESIKQMLAYFKSWQERNR